MFRQTFRLDLIKHFMLNGHDEAAVENDDPSGLRGYATAVRGGDRAADGVHADRRRALGS